MPPRERQQLSEEVAAYVREMIISGEVQPGDFLRMEPIAEAVGVSNTPVREGLLSLRGEGFVKLVPRRGFLVAPFSHQDLRDLFWVQAQLAGELAARAAVAMGPEQIRILEDVHRQYTEAVGNHDTAAVAGLGHQFHRQINLGADSYRLAVLLGSAVKQLPNRFYATIESHVGATSDEHSALLSALTTNDSETARRLMHEHILGGVERLIDTLSERESWMAARS